MSRGRAALLFLLAFLIAAWFPLAARSTPARAAAESSDAVRRAVLVVEDKVSFDQLMGAAQFRALAVTGGAGLMTTKTRSLAASEVGGGEVLPIAYETIADGTLDAPIGREVPGVLTAELARRGVGVCYRGPLSDVEVPFNPTGLFAFTAPHNVSSCQQAALVESSMEVIDTGRTFGLNGFLGVEPALRAEAREIAAALRELGTARTLVVVVCPSTSFEMDQTGDQVTPLVMAVGPADQILQETGPTHALTSPTTRTDGVVANVDVAPTILRFFGVPIPSSMDGAPITVTGKPAPFALHQLHLEQRRSRLPVDLGEVAFIAAVGIAGILVLLLMGSGGSVAPGVARTMRFLALATTAFPLVLLGGGLLPRMTYAVVVPYMVLATAGLAWLSQRAKWPGVLGPFVFLGTVTLSFVVIDGLFGGNAYRIPLYGNTMFDGARFYGISNSFISLLLASAIFVAYRLPTRAGMAVLFATGLFAGFPDLGANVGASITLFAAAGLWWAIRTRRRADAPSVAAGVAATGAAIVLGLAIVFAVNRIAPGGATHATRFVERAGGNARYGLETIRRRLAVGLSQFGHVPAAWIPILGLPIVLAVVLRGPGPVGPGLRTVIPAWRDGILVLILSAIVAYVANDTGVAAAGPAFLYAMAMMAYPAFLSGGSRRPEPERPASEPASAAR